MKSRIYLILLIILTLNIFLKHISSADINDVIIGNINGDNLYLSEFKRLLNAQKKQPQNKPTDTNEPEEVAKNKVLDKMINELLVLQEARARNIEVPEEEVTKKINLIKENQGGDEPFNKFLSENNATIEDARKEAKNQILFELIKNEIAKENNDFKSFINNKKLTATILLYNDKINLTEPIKIESDIALRNNPYPTITKSKVEEIKKLEEKTNQILEQQEKLQQALANLHQPIDIASITEPTVIRPLSPENKNQEEVVKVINDPIIKFNKEKFKVWKEKVLKNKFKLAKGPKEQKQEKQISESVQEPQSLATCQLKNLAQPIAQVAPPPPPPQEPQSLSTSQPQSSNESQFTAKLNELNIFKRGNANLQTIQSTNDISKELEDLRKKIDQRRILPKP